MNTQKTKRTSLLIVLICFTFMAVALTAEILINDWEKPMIIQLAAELVICWTIHIIGKAPQTAEKWLYFALAMHGFIYFGIHRECVFAAAPIIIAITAIYFATELYELINLCAVFYLGVLICNLLFVSRGYFEYTAAAVAGLILNIAAVLLTAYIARLLTERRSSREKSTQAMIAKLEEENRRTEDFLTNVSHELRTPINAVTGLTAVMLNNENDGAKRENLLSVQKAGYRLFGQIEDILDYTEIDTERIKLSEDSYMLSSLINDFIAEMRINRTDKDIELIFDIDAQIPAVLIGDGKKIKKILKHLIDNAVKFTEEGGVYVRIYALRKQYGVNLCIQVKDTGIGMDAESLSKITEKFYQSGGGRDRRAGGLGLGLPIVYGMAAAMNGFVHTESAVGAGTTVTVSLPQRIAVDTPGMRIADPSKLCIACYLIPEKYSVTEIRRFYDDTISHIACGLDIPVHRAFRMSELETLISMYRLTHIFVAEEEYENGLDFFEKLDNSITVVVFADEGYVPKKGVKAKILYKPFYCFPAVNILNSSFDGDTAAEDKRMICPDVRVLVVDDEPMNRIVAEGILKDYQMSVTTAESGAEAIKLCDTQEYDLLFLDHMMPEMDGIETLKRLRKLKNADSFTAIAFTANAVSGAREMFLKEGFDDFLAKPIETPELERVLRKALPKSRIRYVEADRVEPLPQPEPESSENNDITARLEQAGINVEAGLTYCRNDKNFYFQLLEKFAADAPRRRGELDALFDANDTDNYRIQVHALKSTAKMMGADGLSAAAKEMESAAKEHDTEHIAAEHLPLMEEYIKTAQLIEEAVRTDKKADDADTSEYREIAKDELIIGLEGLRDCFGTYEADRAQKLISELDAASYNGTPIKELLSEIKSDVDDFEYESAAEKTTALINGIESGEA